MFTYRLAGTLEQLDHLTPVLWDAGCQGLEEGAGTDGAAVIAYFEQPVELPFGGVWLEADDTDWLARFRASITPIQIGRVWVIPSWWTGPLGVESPEVLPEDAMPKNISIVLEPGLAFGTGHHETTRLAIRALQALKLEQALVLDVGAGSGILALVAAKLGASALGVDNDAQTVPIARENALQNQVEVEFVAGLLEDVLDRGPFDVVVANLFAELHDLLIEQYKTVLVPGGHLILTGILAGTGQADAGERMTWDTSSGREGLVMAALKRAGFMFVNRVQENEWVLLEAKRT